MFKYKYIFIFLVSIVFLSACTSAKNTAGTRWYHSFNTRYNVYFNGDQAYQQALKAQQENHTENYSEMILMFPVSALPKDKQNPGGAFDRAIEKGVKAIKQRSIQTKPARKSGKRSDPKYQEWMSRTEYNPFLHNAWMLMAQAQFHNGDFLQAASSFSYISRLYNTQPEIALNARIWQARCYAEMDWFYEAEDILTKTRTRLPDKLQDWYSTVYADFLIKQKKYQEAVPYLQTSIQAERNGLQKNRQKFLLGQIYKQLGDRNAAFNTFGEVAGSSSIPYNLKFGAQIRQAEVYAGADTTRITRQLRSMAKNSKNKNYLDQLYYALGNVYMAVPDTAKAIEAYELGAAKSVQKGIDKALNQIRLGDLYFEQRKFIQSQPNYAEALGQLKKGDEAFPRVSKRSAILDELVVFVEEVELQDSLQRLSRMSEDERLKVVEKIIADLKKREEEERKLQAREDYLAQQEDLRAQMPGSGRPAMPPAMMGMNQREEGLFYFYNPQVVALGKNTFQQRWGRRRLEDDWRRRNKTNPMSDPFAADEFADFENSENNELNPDSVNAELGGTAELSTDPYDPQFYLQQIPVTEEDIEASNLIISDGLFQMAVIYKDRLEDVELALETFTLLDTRFPEHDNKLIAYYQTFMIYLKEGNQPMAELFKQKIRAEFPNSDYAIAMADPEYEHNLRMMDAVQESLYEATYEAYLAGDVNQIRANYQMFSTKYSQSKLMPKFMFLNALSYVQTNDADGFKEQLRELISRYPDADVSVLASEMMRGFQRGLILSASGDNMLARGSLFNMRFSGAEGELSEEDLALEFSAETNTPHQLMLVYPQGTINANLLLHTVANFNFGNFTVNAFDLERTTIGEIGMLQVKGFSNFGEIRQYIQMIYAPSGYAAELEQAVLIVPISLQNYDILTRGKNLDDYMTFFEENFGEDNQNMVERWRLKQAEELETAEEIEEFVLEEIFEEEIETSEIASKIEEETPTVQEVIVQKTEETITETSPLEETEEILNQAHDVVDNISDKIDEIMADPIKGITNLFKRTPNNAIDEYAREQERADKERQKQLRAEQIEKEKLEREQLKLRQALEKEAAKEKARQENELKQQKRLEEKAKVDEKKRVQKERQDAIKQRDKDRKEAKKIKEQERKAKEKERAEARKQRERERKEAQKLKEQQQKAKAKERAAARKAR
jgi:tetratricopeptide (TPR) repeat protein